MGPVVCFLSIDTQMRGLMVIPRVQVSSGGPSSVVENSGVSLLNGLEITFRQIAVKDSLFRVYILHNLTQSNAAFNTHYLTVNIFGS